MPYNSFMGNKPVPWKHHFQPLVCFASADLK